MKIKNTSLFIISILSANSALAQGGAMGGGGGDPHEMRVNAIRADLLDWISKGGAQAMIWPASTTQQIYEEKMKEILLPQVVNVSFTTKKKKVEVNRVEKTCVGRFDRDDNPYIVCEISKFDSASEAEQYRLVHHEYAGLVSLEKNQGSASDYFLSDQVTTNLIPTSVLKLSVKPRPLPVKTDCTINADERISGKVWALLAQKGYRPAYTNLGSLTLTQDSAVGYIAQVDPNGLPLLPNLPVTSWGFKLSHNDSNYFVHTGYFTNSPEQPNAQKIKLQERLSWVSSVQQGLEIRKQLEEGYFPTTPAIHWFESAAADLPTCEKFYGR